MSDEAQKPNPNELNIQDLATMKGIIDLASERNAFKPNEMAAVGIVYNKLELFLEEVKKQAEAAKEAQEGAAEAVADAPKDGEEAA
jgi:hypothetical protein